MSDPIDPVRLHCPGCEEEVDIAPEAAGRLVRCPYCNTDFFASAEQSHEPVVDDTSSEQLEQDRANAFDKMRIRNYMALRMSAVRVRSWWLIGFWTASLLMLDMAGRIAMYLVYFHRWGWSPTINLLIATGEFLFARHCRKRAAELKKEIDHSSIPEPTTPPDFSTLNDGTDRWKDLENVR
jgi:hypothetical protein